MNTPGDLLLRVGSTMGAAACCAALAQIRGVSAIDTRLTVSGVLIHARVASPEDGMLAVSTARLATPALHAVVYRDLDTNDYTVAVEGAEDDELAVYLRNRHELVDYRYVPGMLRSLSNARLAPLPAAEALEAARNLALIGQRTSLLPARWWPQRRDRFIFRGVFIDRPGELERVKSGITVKGARVLDAFVHIPGQFVVLFEVTGVANKDGAWQLAADALTAPALDLALVS